MFLRRARVRLIVFAIGGFLLLLALLASDSKVVSARIAAKEPATLQGVHTISRFGTKTDPTPTPDATKVAASLKTYVGDGYTIGYPPNWIVNSGNNNATILSPDRLYGMAFLEVNNPNGAVSPSKQLQDEANQFKSMLGNAKDNGTSTVTIGGETWYQDEFKGTHEGILNTYNILVANHPAKASNTRTFEAVYFAQTPAFDHVKATYIQPMLASFTFKP